MPENKILKKINSLENKILGILSFGATKHEKKLFQSGNPCEDNVTQVNKNNND